MGSSHRFQCTRYLDWNLDKIWHTDPVKIPIVFVDWQNRSNGSGVIAREVRFFRKIIKFNEDYKETSITDSYIMRHSWIFFLKSCRPRLKKVSSKVKLK